VMRYFWRKNPIAALLTYVSILFPFCAPFVVLHALVGHVQHGANDGLWFYLIGTYAAALLYALYYAFRRSSGLWHHGMTFVAVYMTVLVFQTYWGIAKIRDNGWGTRDATVDGSDPEAGQVRVWGAGELPSAHSEPIPLAAWDELLPGQAPVVLADAR
jgi:hypothetical protein